MSQANTFNIKFDMRDYKDIAPVHLLKRSSDHIINWKDYKAGNIDLCVWKKQPIPKIITNEYKEQEITRVLKDGVWICIKDEILWIPPNYYFALQFGTVSDKDLEFRLKRLKHVYFKIRARNNSGCKGTFTVKGRGDGETTMSMHDCFWECLDGNMTNGQLGVQSKTRNDAFNPCWMTVQTIWQGLPMWIKDELCSDFASGDNIAEKLRFMRDANEEDGQRARNIIFQYYPSVYTAMDGRHNMKKCVLDEVLKWVECDFSDTLSCYSKFIMPGFERRGLFDIFSSPAEKDCKSYRDGYKLWLESNTDEITDGGTTKSRIHRYYSNPLEGIESAYDKWGDADPQKIYDHLMQERGRKSKDELLGEIRGFPLNDEEIWGTLDSSDFWDNHKGISDRKTYLIGHRFKDEKTKEPTVVFGNLEWPDGIRDEVDPIFRMADKTDFDLDDARFCLSYLPSNKEQLRDIKKPPPIIESCLGIDSVDKRYAGKRPSNFAMVNHRFRDILETGIVKCPTMIYCNRPLPIEIAYEDAIKACVFNRSLVQVESLNTKIVDYFEDRGYIDWMLSKIGQPKNSLMKGDAPSAKSILIDEIVSLLNGITNIPMNKEDFYPLQLNWFYQLLDDISKFNKKDTHENDLSMAWGQSLLGSVKIMFKKIRQKSQLNNEVFSYLLS